VGSPQKKGCFLCSVRKDGNDGSNFVLYRGRHAFAVLNLYPYNNGHIMVVPNRHIRNFENLREDEEKECMAIIRATLKILKKILKAEGFNIGLNLGKVSGAGLESHLHFHVVPRWTGDTNFMPVITGTKVISQSLEELYSILKGEFEVFIKREKKGF